MKSETELRVRQLRVRCHNQISLIIACLDKDPYAEHYDIDKLIRDFDKGYMELEDAIEELLNFRD